MLYPGAAALLFIVQRAQVLSCAFPRLALDVRLLTLMGICMCHLKAVGFRSVCRQLFALAIETRCCISRKNRNRIYPFHHQALSSERPSIIYSLNMPISKWKLILFNEKFPSRSIMVKQSAPRSALLIHQSSRELTHTLNINIPFITWKLSWFIGW